MRCHVNISDLDGDPISVYYEWHVASNNTYTIIGTVSSLQLIPGLVQSGDVLRCTISVTNETNGMTNFLYSPAFITP